MPGAQNHLAKWVKKMSAMNKTPTPTRRSLLFLTISVPQDGHENFCCAVAGFRGGGLSAIFRRIRMGQISEWLKLFHWTGSQSSRWPLHPVEPILRLPSTHSRAKRGMPKSPKGTNDGSPG